jgi:hypothetical protein
MRRGRQANRLIWVFALGWMTLAGVTGCSRQLAVSRSTGTAGTGQLPFDRASDGSGVSPTAAFAFEGLPAGTEISIRLRSALSSADSRVGDSFEAVLDESVILAGKTVAPRGAPVTGSVVDTKASAGHDPGYLRMTLASIAMNGKSIPLQTSSIFIKGNSFERRTAAIMKQSQAIGKGPVPETFAEYGAGTRSSSAATPGDVRFSTGHRLTFRLIQPLHLSG